VSATPRRSGGGLPLTAEEFIDVDAEDDAEEGHVVLDGDEFVTGDAIPTVMMSTPWLLPQHTVVQLRRPLDTPGITPFEVEHHYTIHELRDAVLAAGVLDPDVVRKASKAVLVAALLDPTPDVR
jgi:hypothetical protein